jgi:transcriptional regulator GlxA family with amidase domain
MRAMIIQNKAQLLASFILILDALASASKSERQSLVSEMYAPSLSEETVRRIDQVRNWIITHLESQIRLEEVAFEAGMSPKSFSRFFKKNTGMTFIQYVNELRIGVACRSLRPVYPKYVTLPGLTTCRTSIVSSGNEKA